MRLRSLALIAVPVSMAQCAPTCAPSPPPPPIEETTTTSAPPPPPSSTAATTTVPAPTTVAEEPRECLDPATLLFGDFHDPVTVWYGTMPGMTGPVPVGVDLGDGCIDGYDYWDEEQP